MPRFPLLDGANFYKSLLYASLYLFRSVFELKTGQIHMSASYMPHQIEESKDAPIKQSAHLQTEAPIM